MSVINLYLTFNGRSEGLNRRTSQGPSSFGEEKGEEGRLSGTITVKKGFAARSFKHRLATVRRFHCRTSKIPSTKSSKVSVKVGYEVQKAQRKSAKYTQRRVNRKIENK